MDVARGLICGAMAVALVGLTQPIDARAQQFPALDGRLLFDPTPLDQSLHARERGAGPWRTQTPADQPSAAATNEQVWLPNTYGLWALEFGPSGNRAERSTAAGLGPTGNWQGSGAVEGATWPGPRRALGTFSLGLETDRAATPRTLSGEEATSTDEAPFGRKPKRRFVPFIGLSAKSPI